MSSTAPRFAPEIANKGRWHVWLSGQIPANAQGNLIQGSTVEKAKAIIQNTEVILKEAGSGLDRDVKVVVYVKDAGVMPEFASAYDPAFPHRPARSMVEVSKLPDGVDIQVDFIVVATWVTLET
ncbi:YjgF-like protein [Aspergillus leporis]|uniref:YjgF-like protein n=1 Tax=Aspergillus leporis TaxID=41062 RepID=A0A5N5XBM4_9EURO|nr:YjgF-like protein [Aspergillus leporis]